MDGERALTRDLPGDARGLEAANRELEAANRELRAANDDLRRINARLARDRMGVGDAAAAAFLARLRDAELRIEAAEARALAAEAEARARIEDIERRYDAPRYHAVDAVRSAMLRAPRLHRGLRHAWERLAARHRRT